MATSIQWALLVPLLLLVVFGILQIGLIGYGRAVAANAATAAAEEACLYQAPPGAGVDIGRSVAVAGGLLDVDINVSRGAETAVATVSGRMPNLIELGQTRITEQVSRPTERVTNP